MGRVTALVALVALVEETWMAGNAYMNVREVIREIRLSPLGPWPLVQL